ncbi:GNAT family N-acetyltransferase [Fusibacter bizertensis]|uniref:GNAT family N-acetyltransferase n=1 Tax=Fusibacter bizertensis TaxID=1488331 RepID=A0ABT6N8Y1_9FIRM|nr:GNAT family N-acetyltransferase [Fusibacter bizertensis]MDH8676869.1 GNAT family N-acetyltransferase [Fusibacter bizertensis]
MNNDQFERIIDMAKDKKYSSLNYVDFEDLSDAMIVVDEAEVKLLLDRSKEPNEIYYAADDLKYTLDVIKEHSIIGLIKFIPLEAIPLFEQHGFDIHCIFQDYILRDLDQLTGLKSQAIEMQFASIEDAKALAKLSQACKGMSRGFYGETEEWFIEWLAENKVLVHRIDGEIVGFCCISIYSDGEVLWIRELAVSPKFQGRGIGRNLLKAGLSYGHIQGAKKGFLAVDTENANAIHLYKQFGFVAKENEFEVQLINK